MNAHEVVKTEIERCRQTSNGAFDEDSAAMYDFAASILESVLKALGPEPQPLPPDCPAGTKVTVTLNGTVEFYSEQDAYVQVAETGMIGVPRSCVRLRGEA